MPKRPVPTKDKPNVVLFGIDSLLSTHMSCYGYQHYTTPHIDEFAEESVLFENNFCPHVPTTSGYASMLTGRDCFGTNVVALRHHGPMSDKTKTLAEILAKAGYDTSCVGFTGNPASRGFHKYLDFVGWGSLEDGTLPKAGNLNQVAIPELERLASGDKPFFLMLRHMDPHSPYMPPKPFDRMFYHGNEFDKRNKSMKPVFDFVPFRDYFLTWMPIGVTDKDYIIAQYDGAVAYMDACIKSFFMAMENLGILDDTLVIINADHGETLYDHECWFDHHGTYDVTLRVPLIMRYPRRLPMGLRVPGFSQHKDLVPTVMDLLDLKPRAPFDGQSLMPMVRGEVSMFESEFYITECTWMRKHGWRTPEWKLIVALEPDFHFKPPVELYNLAKDPDELNNVAEQEPGVVETLRKRMEAFIAKREKEEGIKNPMVTQKCWHGYTEAGPAFKTSEQAYNTLHIGDPVKARELQAKAH